MRVHGYSAIVGTTRKDLWFGAGDIPLATTAIGLALKSDAAADDGGSTGARNLRVEYLDSSWEPASLTSPALTGLTEVDCSTPLFMRAQALYVTAAGSGAKNAGNITALIPSGADQASMPIGWNVGAFGAFTVPNGREGIVRRCGFSFAAGQQCEGFLLGNFDPVTKTKREAIFYTHYHTLFRDGVTSITLDKPLIVPEKCAVKLAAIAGAAGQTIAGWFEIDIQ